MPSPLPRSHNALLDSEPWLTIHQNEALEDTDDKRGAGGDMAFWKRARNMDSFWKRGLSGSDAAAAFWKRGGTSAFWKRAPGSEHSMNAFWKRGGADPEMEKLMRALTTLREYIEFQKQRANSINKSVDGINRNKATNYEVIDENTNDGMALSANLPKEEMRREDQNMRPEFNPTGW